MLKFGQHPECQQDETFLMNIYSHQEKIFEEELQRIEQEWREVRVGQNALEKGTSGKKIVGMRPVFIKLQELLAKTLVSP